MITGGNALTSALGSANDAPAIASAKNFCRDVIGNDFDLTENKFSYKRLKELALKVPELC